MKLNANMMSWDWKDSPDEEDLNSILNPFGVYAKYVDSGGDDYILVVANKRLTKKQANAIYKDWEDDGA